jgi:hypothetical protein
MHKHFADWYREASVDPNSKRLAVRWKGVEKAASQELSRERVADLLSWAYRVDPEPGSSGWLREYFQAEDEAFAMRGNDQEMAVLGAAVMIMGLEQRADSAVLALSVVNAALFLGDSVVPDLTTVGSEALAEQAERVREVPRPPKRVRFEQWTKMKSDIGVLGEFRDAGELPTLAAKLEGVLEAASAAFESLRTAENSLISYTKAVAEVQSEESDLYWWVLRHRSVTRGDETVINLALKLARELTEVTNFAVDHPSSGEFLRHAVSVYRPSSVRGSLCA